VEVVSAVRGGETAAARTVASEESKREHKVWRMVIPAGAGRLGRPGI
jgi:hypothetical protein